MSSTITIEQIENIRRRARDEGDAYLDALCAAALGTPYGPDDHCLDPADWREVSRLNQDQAIARLAEEV